jgi:hypothetical protein
MKPRHYRKTGENSFDWPPFVAHCREPLSDLVKKKNCKLSDIENAIGKVETKLWSSLISVYIDEGQIAGGGKMIKADHHVGEIPDTVLSKAYRRILPGWLTFHDGQDFSLVSSTLGIENGVQLKKLEKWLDGEKLLEVTDKVFRHRILKSVPSMDQDPDVELLKGVALSSCADVVATWFSSLVVERNGNLYVLRPLFDERKKKLAKQFLDYLVDMEVLKDPAITFPSANRERSREDIQQDLDGIKSGISSLNGFDMLAKLFYSKEETGKAREEEKSKNTLEQNIKKLIPPIVPALGIFAVAGHFGEISSQRLQEAKAIKERRDKLSAALMQAVGIHLGQLKTLAKVKSSFCSLHDALPPAGDDQASPFDEVQQFNNQHLDRVLKVEEYVSRWNWRIGIVALIGVAQLVGAIAFPFFSAGLIGEGLNDLMFAFQSLQSPGSFSWKSYLVDKAKSLAVTALTMGLGAARLVKACGGSFRQAAKLMCRFNGTLKGWFQAGKKILIQCANMISSSVIGQAVSRFLTWLNKFIMEQVLERIKSFLFNNFLMRPAFTQLKDLMKSLMIAIVKSGKSAGEASRKIKEVLDGAANQLKAGDWFTELRTNASSITSRMTGIFNGSSAGLSGLQGNYAGEYRSHASTGNTQGIIASANAGTIEKAIQVGKTIVDYGQKAAEVTKEINKFATKCESVKKLATHGVTYVGDLNAALQDELRALKTKNKQGQQSAVGESTGGGLSKTEAERFEKFMSDTEGEIQSSIMKETLDTIQSTWLEPKIQLKVERKVKSISSKFVKKYCPSLLPEGANDLKDNNNTNNGVGDGQMPTEDQWIDEMGNGRPAGPIEMQNSVDAYGFVLELEDKTGQYTQGDKFYYYPEGNPYSNKPVVKMSFTQNDDGTKHVCLIMPDGTKHEYVPDPSEPPNRCFFNALSKAQKDPSVDHTIEKLKNHAKGNDRARFMSKLGVNQSYQHLQVGAYRKIRNGKTTTEVDKCGRPVRIITTETERKQERNSKNMKEIKEKLGYQERGVYSHDVSLNSGGVNDFYNISRMTHECNRYLFKVHEENFEDFRDYNKQNGSPEVITRVITKHYEHSVGEILRMEKEGKYVDRYKIKGYQHDFYTGSLEQPTNQYLSGFIPNWNGQQASIFHARNKDSRKMKKTDARRKATNVPIVRGPEFKKFFANIRKH